METREELRSILPYLPVVVRSSSPFWPSQAVETLRELGRGRVDSGHHLFLAISDLRNALSLSSEPLAPSVSHGYALFFDEVMSGEESRKWFQEVVPALGNLLLRLPSLLEAHYESADNMTTHGEAALLTTTALRLLDSQQPGIVFLTQSSSEVVVVVVRCPNPLVDTGLEDPLCAATRRSRGSSLLALEPHAPPSRPSFSVVSPPFYSSAPFLPIPTLKSLVGSIV
ncbi:Poly(ADP-ribose) glycohydrolase 1, partial [Mucuna pruriens]